MRLGRLLGIPMRLHPLALPMMALALWLGEGQRLTVMIASILLHELAHIAAARTLHVRVVELELMPAGGAARLENLWQLRPGQMAAVALAGPLCNLLLMTISAALCWWRVLSPDWAAMLIEQNAVILLFNLLPALPMDGGRVMCGLLGRRLSPAAAARVGVWTARGLAVGLGILSLMGILRGQMNITLPVAAAFLMLTGSREREQAESAALQSLMSRQTELEAEGVLPVRLLAMRQDTPAREAAARMRPRCVHLIAVHDEQLRLVGVVDERALIRALLGDAGQSVGQCAFSPMQEVAPHSAR